MVNSTTRFLVSFILTPLIYCKENFLGSIEKRIIKIIAENFWVISLKKLLTTSHLDSNMSFSNLTIHAPFRQSAKWCYVILFYVKSVNWCSKMEAAVSKENLITAKRKLFK